MLRNRPEFYRWSEDAVARVEPRTDLPGVGRVRACAAVGAAKRGDLVGARRLVAIEPSALDDERRFCIEALAQVALYEGRLEDAAASARLAARLHAEAGDQLFATNAATVEAAALAYSGRLADAESLARNLARSADALGVPSLQAMTCYILAETILDPVAAARLYEKSIQLATTAGAGFVTGLASTSLAAREIRSGRYEQARRRLAYAIGHWQRAGVRHQQWLATRLLIEVLSDAGEHTAAATLAGAHAASDRAGSAFGDDARRLGDALDRARDELGDAAYTAARQRGAAMNDDQAAAYAQSAASGRGVGR
jgi:hypothetical protein